MKKIFAIALMLVASMTIKAQTYYVSQIPYNPMPFDSGIQVVGIADDMYSDIIPIGFDFYFFGNHFDQLLLSTNSTISFELSNANNYCQWPISAPIPSTSNPVNSIFFPMQDDYVPAGGSISHEVYGVPPHRKFVMNYDSVAMFSCTALTFTGQVILYEGSNNIEIHLQHKDTCVQWNSGAAILGIQDSTGTQSFVASNYNYPNVWAADNEAWLFSPDSIYSPQLNQNRISGRVFADLNFDCAYGGTDYPLMNKPVIISDTSGNTQYMFTDMQGYYSKYVDAGVYTWTTNNIANQNYATNCPVGGSFTYTFPGFNDSTDNNFIADTIVDYCSDLTVSIWAHGEDTSWWNGQWWWGWDPLGVCDTGYVQLYVSNNGTMSDNATVTLTLNDSTSILNSPVAYTSLGNNQYTLDLGNLAAGADTNIVIMIQAGCDTIGTPYCFAASVGGGVFDCWMYNNSDNICVQIGVPFDPNAMYVSSSLHPSNSFTDYLPTQTTDNFDYTVTFQNTGTAPAHDVHVETIIDSHLNLNSITPGASSANYNWLVLGNKLIFYFDNIELIDSGTNEPASHGFVRFKIEQNSGNVTGTIIPQMANIYFDYVSPVATNNAVVELVADEPNSIVTVTPDVSTSIYPNPASESFFINSNSTADYLVQDLLGRTIQQGKIMQATSVSVKDWKKGIYFITVQTHLNKQVMKLIV
ncbi:MAG: T9SS type A sorting domain-containing protein, partial [Bacteroidota bacterium]